MGCNPVSQDVPGWFNNSIMFNLPQNHVESIPYVPYLYHICTISVPYLYHICTIYYHIFTIYVTYLNHILPYITTNTILGSTSDLPHLRFRISWDSGRSFHLRLEVSHRGAHVQDGLQQAAATWTKTYDINMWKKLQTINRLCICLRIMIMYRFCRGCSSSCYFPKKDIQQKNKFDL